MGSKKRVADAQREDDLFDALALLIDEQVEKEIAIPIVVAKRGVLVCSQCASRVETAAVLRTEHYRRTLIVCQACVKIMGDAMNTAEAHE